MHFIRLQRGAAQGAAPVVSFHADVNTGSVDDPKGRTSLAHMFEHLAFKGAEAIGSANWPAERPASKRSAGHRFPVACFLSHGTNPADAPQPTAHALHPQPARHPSRVNAVGRG